MISTRSYAMRGRPLIPGVVCPDVSENTVATILFADLHGYDALIEPFAPSEVALLLAELYEMLSGIVLERGGQIYALFEAGMLAGFGVGDTRHAHTAAAFAAARAMQTHFEAVRSCWQKQHRIDTALGIGIHRGEVAFGRFGPVDRSACTLVGEATHGAVQLARRARAGEILLSAAAYVPEGCAPSVPAATLKRLPPLQIRGRSAPLEVWCAALSDRLPMRPARTEPH